MIRVACGICPGHGGTGQTTIDISTNGKKERSAKGSVLEVLRDIDDIPQISFPIYGNKYITRYMGSYAYINLVESPGVAFIATSRPPGSAAMSMMQAVLDCVPMIVLSVCMAFISGFIIWVLVSKSTVVLPNISFISRKSFFPHVIFVCCASDYHQVWAKPEETLEYFLTFLKNLGIQDGGIFCNV